MKKITSLLLAFLMFVGTFATLGSYEALATETTDAETQAPSEDAPGEETEGEDKEEDGEQIESGNDIDYTAVVYETPEAKLASMTLRVQNENFELYSFTKTGEIAVRDRRTGQVLFSNPYDIGSTSGATSTKEMLLSQLVVNFNKGDDKNLTYYSYVEAALRDQIVVKNIKGGVRVEYTIGRTETRKLVPRMITKERFETVILAEMQKNAPEAQWNTISKYFDAFYLLKDPEAVETTAELQALYADFPITKKIGAVYVIGSDTKDREYNKLEEYIKAYCPNYSYEELDYDHDLTEYTVTNIAPPLFRMAIEYHLDKTGVTATLAANSIRFDETAYKLTSIIVLPYFGAGDYKNNKGYTFIPDGSGTITRFEDMAQSPSASTIAAKVYGQDFAYYTNETKHRQTIRLPVYGIVENYEKQEIGMETVDFIYYYDKDGGEIHRNLKLESFFNNDGTLNESISDVKLVNQGFYNAQGELVWLTPGVTTLGYYDVAGNPIDAPYADGTFYHNLLDNNGKTTGEIVKATTVLPQDGKYYDVDGNLVATKMNTSGMSYYDKDGKFVSNNLPVDMIYRDRYGSIGNIVASGSVVQTTVTGEDKGYFAIITEGDSLAEITSSNGGATHNYASLLTTVYPRPTDKYNLADATSVGSNVMWQITSTRKYTGNYTIKYFMLADEEKAEEYIESLSKPAAADAEEDENEVEPEIIFTPVVDEDFAETYYPANYMGMVNACRDYLEEAGIIKRLTAEQIKKDIPLTIETMGVIYSTKRILSIPVTVKVPLTTFDDIQTMNNALKENGITNTVYKLTGFANGGMNSTVPYKLKWEKAAGGSDGFKDLMEYAEENDIGVYPEFDFSYVNSTGNFDGFSYKKHAVKTMDNRYTSKRQYNPAYQQFEKISYSPISPSVFEYFYDKFSPKLADYKPTGISSSTLGSDLNSDFDKEDPYNREDSKAFVTKLLEKMEKDYGSVMLSGGNSYVLPYADYILEVPLDSSQLLKSSNAIPFYGMVLHGYVNFTGNALNMAGDIDYEILKAIENGASMYFIFAYQNTDKLKDSDDFQKYYSVNFKIWEENGIYDRYNTLNEALRDVQDKLIVDHEFITGIRVLTAEEQAQEDADNLRAEEEAKKEQEKEDAKLESGDESVDASKPEQDTNKDENKYLINNGKIVKVTYEGGKTFILNYNNYKVSVDGQIIDALDFIVLNEGGNN